MVWSQLNTFLSGDSMCKSAFNSWTILSPTRSLPGKRVSTSLKSEIPSLKCFKVFGIFPRAALNCCIKRNKINDGWWQAQRYRVITFSRKTFATLDAFFSPRNLHDFSNFCRFGEPIIISSPVSDEQLSARGLACDFITLDPEFIQWLKSRKVYGYVGAVICLKWKHNSIQN
jgi:hypothetical protein